MPMSEYMEAVRSRVGNLLLEIPSVSVLSYDDRDRVLLVYHADVRLWTTPGGAVEPRETPANAAVREMWEETGLHVDLTGILGVYGGPEFSTTYSNGDRVSFLMTVFEGRPLGGELRPDGEETLRVAYFSRDELREVEVQTWVPPVLENAWANRSKPHFAPPTWSPPHP